MLWSLTSQPTTVFLPFVQRPSVREWLLRSYHSHSTPRACSSPNLSAIGRTSRACQVLVIFPEHTYGCGTAALDNSILFPSGTFFGTQNGAFHGSVMNAGSFSLASIFCAPRVGYGWAHGCTRALTSAFLAGSFAFAFPANSAAIHDSSRLFSMPTPGERKLLSSL